MNSAKIYQKSETLPLHSSLKGIKYKCIKNRRTSVLSMFSSYKEVGLCLKNTKTSWSPSTVPMKQN